MPITLKIIVKIMTEFTMFISIFSLFYSFNNDLVLTHIPCFPKSRKKKFIRAAKIQTIF
jgi:hypothetical protein